MNKRLITGLAAALALSACTTYDYVDRGGGYYTGSSARSVGGGYGGYGYGPYLGSTYGAYRYRPGWSFGIGYGYGGDPYGYYPYGYRPYGYYPPAGGHYPRPPYRPRPGDQSPPEPSGPPVAEPRPPKLDGAPWRNLDEMHRQRQVRPYRRAAEASFPADAGGAQVAPQPGSGGYVRPQRPGSFAGEGMERPLPREGYSRPAERPRFVGEGGEGPPRYRPESRGEGGEPRMQSAPRRDAPRHSPPSEPSRRPERIATQGTEEP